MQPNSNDESDRLADLRRLAIVGTPPEPHFDAVCRLARDLFAVPIAAVAFVEADRQWFKASCGLAIDGTPRDAAFCAHTILSDAPLIVPDATADPRFSANPLVLGAPGIRFYAGVPLALRSGLRLGTLCLIDTVPRPFPPDQVRRLQDMAEVVLAHLRLHEANREQATELVVRARLTDELKEANRVLTERETALRAAGELLRGTIDSMDQGLLVLSPDQSVRAFNASAAELLELPADVLRVGASLAEICAHQRARGDFAELPPDLRAAMENRVQDRLPLVFDWPKPSGVVLEMRRSPLAVGGTVVTFTDATQQRLTERAVQESEARFRLLAENATDIIMRCDLTTTRRYVSPAVTAVLGYLPEDLIGTRPLDFVHPDEAEAYDHLLTRLTAGHTLDLTTTQRYRHRDGHWVWLEISFKLTHGAATGRPDGYVAALRDVSARKAMEEALREGEVRYRALVEARLQAAQAQVDFTTATSAAILAQLAEGVIVTDTAGRITLVNSAAAAIHGVARLDVAPESYSDTYHLFTENGRPHPPHDLPLARAVRGERVSDARWCIRRPNGDEVSAIGSAQPLLGSDGRRIGAVLTLRDDTARAAAESSLRELNATLSQRVAERTREAEAAQALAEAGSLAKTEFLATMSHEIRTPLNGVIGYADLLCEEPGLTTAARLHAERIRGAGAALLTVVDDILDFSKIEAGQVEIAPKPFVLGDLLDATLAIVRGPAEAKGLAVNVRLGSALPGWVMGDADRLRQILLNLLGNAIKFTASGWISLTVEAERPQSDVAHVRFAVTDTGIGIPANRRDRLFQRFSQVDGSIARSYGGTGLGLAICRRLVELMEGTIGIESQQGCGSTFWFTLALPQAAPEITTPAADACVMRSVRRRILLAEDVPLNQELACAILRRAGHTVDVVGDGAAAVAAVWAKPYDLVLMDIQMPVLDGLKATRQIRALDGAAAQVPIVAMTANVLPEQVAQILAAGADGHVGKPFRANALLETVERRSQRAIEERTASAGQRIPSHPTMDASLNALGRTRVNELLAGLAAELEKRFGSLAPLPDRDKLAFDAHAILPAADMLGFRELGQMCREAEQVCRAGGDPEPFLTKLRISATDTIAKIVTLRAA